MILLFGHDQTVADWVSKKWGKPIQPWYYAIGVLDSHGILRGGLTLHNFNGSNIELCYYGPKTVSVDVVRGMAKYFVEYLKITRLTVSVPKYNKTLRRGLLRLGFKVEGVLKHFYGPYNRDDAVIFGILASQIRKYIR